MRLDVPSILITDDDQSFRETLQDVLEPEGYRTILAGDGEEALSIVASHDVHLVLLDMHMPKLTGLDTLRQLKRIKTVLPCILLSADADENLMRQAEREHAFRVLRKPVSRGLITGVVRNAIERTYR